jgi:hypothetical protein
MGVADEAWFAPASQAHTPRTIAPDGGIMNNGGQRRYGPCSAWTLRALAGSAILAAIGLTGCKTVQYTAPPPELVVPVVIDAAAIPTLTQVRYRPLGKVPYRGELTNAAGERTQLEGYATIVPTERGTLRIGTYFERVAWDSGKGKGLKFTISDGLFSDYEIDSQGYPRRIYEVAGAPSVSGSGNLDADFTKALRETLFKRSEVDRMTEAASNPIYRDVLNIGSSVFASSLEDFAHHLLVAQMALTKFVTDKDLERLLSEPLPAAYSSARVTYRSSEKIVGVAYVDGYEFLSAKGILETTAPNVRRRNNLSILIDPYSGFPYIIRSEIDQTVDGKSETKTAALIFNLPKRFDRVIQPAPVRPNPRAAPDIATPAPPATVPESAPRTIRPMAPGEVGTISDLYKSSVPAVVTVLVGSGSGSGFFISRDLVVTNAHVIGAANSVEIELHSGRKLSARVVERGDGDLDLAVLRLATPVDVRPLTIAKDLPEPGTPVVVIGGSVHGRGVISPSRSV